MTSNLKLTLIAEGSTTWQRFIRRWGVSYLLGEDMLFDTFGDANIFMKSLARREVDIAKIRHIVISHDHWDHLAGLCPFLEKNKDVMLYICPGFSKATKEKLAATGAVVVEVNAAREIREGIYTTGPIHGIYNNKDIEEQALVVKTRDGLAIVTGCAHPGITNIVARVAEDFDQPIAWVLGGFHLKEAARDEIERVVLRLQENGVQKIVPLHCTGALADDICRRVFGQACIDWQVGQGLEL